MELYFPGLHGNSQLCRYEYSITTLYKYQELLRDFFKFNSQLETSVESNNKVKNNKDNKILSCIFKKSDIEKTRTQLFLKYL